MKQPRSLQAVSRPDGHVLPPDELVAPRVLRGEAVSSFNAVPRCVGDEERIISATSAPVWAGPDERVELVVSVMHDQTEAAKLDRVRDDLFAAAAHTIKTEAPLYAGLRLERQVSEHLVTAQGGRILRESPASESRTIWVEFPRFEGRADVAS